MYTTFKKITLNQHYVFNNKMIVTVKFANVKIGFKKTPKGVYNLFK